MYHKKVRWRWTKLRYYICRNPGDEAEFLKRWSLKSRRKVLESISARAVEVAKIQEDFGTTLKKWLSLLSVE